MTTNKFTPLDSLKELTARADQQSPTIIKALRDLYQPGTEAGPDPYVSSMARFVQTQCEFSGHVAAALNAHEPDPVEAGHYSDGRDVTSTVVIGDSGFYTYVWPADPDGVLDEPQVLVGESLWQINIRDGAIHTTRIEP